MRTLVKAVVVLVAVVAVAAVAGVSYLYARYPEVPPAETVTITATPEKLARGEYLAQHVTGCVICHAERDMTKYGGPVMPGTLGAGGEFFGDQEQGLAVYSRNITPAVLGDWSDGEIIRAFTSGVSKDGQPLFPIMPYPRYARLAREDVESIVVYLRTLKPVTHAVPDRRLPFPLPLVVRTMPKPAALPPMPSRADKLAYGEYLTNAAVCAECHTPIDDRGQALPGRDYAGGTEFKLPNGAIVRPANITPDADTGIGTWTEAQFIDKFKAWEATEARPLTAAEQRENTIMPWMYYAGMTREDLSAIYTYLRARKPVINRVQKFN